MKAPSVFFFSFLAAAMLELLLRHWCVSFTGKTTHSPLFFVPSLLPCWFCLEFFPEVGTASVQESTLALEEVRARGERGM